MQKVLAMLEDKVQWIAIALGALFVLFMTWTYVINPPASVEIGGEKLTPGEVDRYTIDHTAKQLDDAIKNNQKIDIPVPTYVQAFKDTMAWKNGKPMDLASNWNSPTGDIPLPTAENPNQPPVPGPGGTQQPGPGPVKVTQLPVPPAPTPDSFKFGRSVVLLPPAPGQPPPQPPAPGQEVVGGVDKDWVTELFKINITALDDAFKASKIPPGDFHKTVFLAVEMERQEVDAGGKPMGPPTTLPTIAQWRQNQPAPAFPPEGSPRELAGQYLQWASANTADILQPLYYVIAKGDQWQKPGAQPVGLAVFDPNQYLTGEIPANLTNEQKEAIRRARQAKYKLDQEQKKAAHPRPAPRTPSGPRGPGLEGDSTSYAPNPNYAPVPAAAPGAGVAAPGSAPARHFAPAPAAAPPRAPVAGRPPPGYGPGIRQPYPPDEMEGGVGYGGSAPVVPGLPTAGVDYPSGEFDPADPKWKAPPVNGVIETWAHDDSIVAGKTYQYRLRYKIKSPVFAAGNVTDPQELADQFALTSPWSNWSSPITIPPLINFFVASSKSPNGNTVLFDVFRYVGGEQKKEQFSVGPGDTIGTVKNNVDFGTGWTVVDFREDPRANDWQILLVNDKNEMMTRSYKADSSDQLYKGLKETVKAAEGTIAGAGGVGMPPTGGIPSNAR